MKPYILISPPYTPTSGGVKVMYGLYGWLLAKGCEAYMNQLPNDKNPNDVIAIYPEIQYGNPVGTDKVMRYVLNTPGVMQASDQYGRPLPQPENFDGEHVYYFSRMFGDVSDTDHYLFLPVINLQTFKDLGRKRTKTCYLIGKGKNGNAHPRDSIELNREVARDQRKLNEILNECHTMYCYDNLTAMMEVARLAGCKVSYHGDYTLDELKKYEPGLNGIDSTLNVTLFRNRYISMIDTFEKRLDTFIRESQQW